MNDEKDPQGNPWIKSAMIWAGVIVALLLFVSLFDSRTATTAGTGIAYSEFRSKVQEGQVKDLLEANSETFPFDSLKTLVLLVTG